MTRLIVFLLPICLLTGNLPALAQTAEPTLEQKVEAHLDSKPPERFITVTEENDKFGSGSDENYTNGTRISWFNTHAKPLAAVRALNVIPGIEINDTTSVSYSLGQNMYTPQNQELETPDPDDRPYAGFLYASTGLTTVSDNHIDDLEVTLGVVGPLSLAEQTQDTIHSAIGSEKAEGWDSQLDNEPGLILSWQRLWPEAVKLDAPGDLMVRVSPYAGATVGNVYTYGSGGMMVQLMPEKDQWQSNPIRVRPAIPGNGYFSTQENRLAWSLFAGVEGRGIGRNIFLDGNTFSDSASVDKKYLVGDANAGVALAYGQTRISYTLNYRTEEFHGQDGGSVFGAISVGYRF